MRSHVRAAELGLELINELPICLRLVNAMHDRLMQGARGDHPAAGEFRTRQNWIGPRRGSPITESLFVPPPSGDELNGCLNLWEAWVNRENGLPVSAKVALAHYQFETIHPFVDGNGRVGRLLAALSFITSGELSRALAQHLAIL